MARRSDHSKEEIREMILVAAEKIVDAQGYSGLSARKIAAEIGYTVGTLYLVFKNLDELTLTVNARSLDKLYTHLCAAVKNCGSPQGCVIILGRAYIEFAKMFPSRWNMIFEQKIPDDVVIPIWYESRVEQIFELIELHMAPLMTRHSEQKLAQVARTLWCGVHGICVLAMTKKLRILSAGLENRVGSNIENTVESLTDSLINNFLAGLKLELELKEIA